MYIVTYATFEVATTTRPEYWVLHWEAVEEASYRPVLLLQGGADSHTQP